jgi:hypothetical protein
MMANHEIAALVRLALGPVPFRWVRTATELDGFRRLTFRGVAEFDGKTKSYRLTTPKEKDDRCPTT